MRDDSPRSARDFAVGSFVLSRERGRQGGELVGVHVDVISRHRVDLAVVRGRDVLGVEVRVPQPERVREIGVVSLEVAVALLTTRAVGASALRGAWHNELLSALLPVWEPTEANGTASFARIFVPRGTLAPAIFRLHVASSSSRRARRGRTNSHSYQNVSKWRLARPARKRPAPRRLRRKPQE